MDVKSITPDRSPDISPRYTIERLISSACSQGEAIHQPPSMRKQVEAAILSTKFSGRGFTFAALIVRSFAVPLQFLALQ